MAIPKGAIDRTERTVEVAFSSEDPIEDWPGVSHVLDHGPEAVRLDRLNDGAPVLVNHDRGDHVGVVERAWIGDDRIGRALLRFGKSARANEVFEDVASGIRRHISVGANILTDDSGEMAVIEQEANARGKVFRVMRWEPQEISFASVPANHKLGIGRSKPEPSKPKGKTMTDPTNQPAQADLERARADAEKSARDHVAQILEIGEKYEVMDLAREAITNAMPYDKFMQKAVDTYFERKQKELETLEAGKEEPITAIGLSANETRRYSISRALNAVLENNWKGAEFELECSRQIEKTLDRQARGVFIPHEVQVRAYSKKPDIQREMTTGGAGTGAEVVGTRHSPENFIEQLRVMVVAIAAGARMLPGLRQNLDIPKKTSGATFAWLAEGGTVTLSDLGTGNLLLSPKTVAGGVQATRRMVKQSLPAIDDLIMQDLVEGAAEAIDLGILQGTGLTNQPTGVFNTSGVNTQTVVAAGNPTLAEAVGFRSAVATDNALRGALSFITTSAVVGNMMLRALDTGSGRFLIDPVTRSGLLGYPYRETNALTASRILFGNWNEVLVGMWGVLDLRPDPYTAAASDAIIIRAFQDVDVGVRHAESFCVSA